MKYFNFPGRQMCFFWWGQILHIGNFTLRLKSLAATALCRILEQARCIPALEVIALLHEMIANCWVGFVHDGFCTINPLSSYNLKMALQVTWACNMMPNDICIILVVLPCGWWSVLFLCIPNQSEDHKVMHFKLVTGGSQTQTQSL